LTERAYVDSSCFIAIALEEPGFEAVIERLETFDVWFSSTLMEAELRSVLARSGSSDDGSVLTHDVSWVTPPRPLHALIGRVLAAGDNLRGADVWHVACALYAAGRPEQMTFLTLDNRQRDVARRLGFRE
jgi:predicted nucleic acid-binding protein